MTALEISEIVRQWFVLLLGLIAAYFTIKTFRENIKQRNLENTFKMLDYLRRHITDKQIETFKALFRANIASSELARTPKNEFHFVNLFIVNNEFQPNPSFDNIVIVNSIEHMFSEGGCGNQGNRI